MNSGLTRASDRAARRELRASRVDPQEPLHPLLTMSFRPSGMTSLPSCPRSIMGDMKSTWGLVILLAVVVSSCQQGGRSATPTTAAPTTAAPTTAAPTVTTTTIEVTGQIEGTLLMDTVIRLPASGGTVVVL